MSCCVDVVLFARQLFRVIQICDGWQHGDEDAIAFRQICKASHRSAGDDAKVAQRGIHSPAFSHNHCCILPPNHPPLARTSTLQSMQNTPPLGCFSKNIFLTKETPKHQKMNDFYNVDFRSAFTWPGRE